MWIDGHLDLAYLALCGRDLRVACPDPETGCVSLPALREAGIGIAFATIFAEPGRSPQEHPAAYPGSDDLDAAEAAGWRQIEIYRQLEAQGELAIIRDAGDLHRDTPLTEIVILMEGADPIRSPEAVGRWFEAGLRMVGLTWARGTRYAGGNARPGPLTGLGRDLVAAMDEAGIVHDASHLADEALDGLLETARGRIVATHSNCRAITGDDQRHLRDDQIKAIGERDGVVGLNLYSRFLVTSGRATIGDCVKHVEHVAGVMGHRRGVALGSDADGGFGPDRLPEHLDHPTKFPALAAALRDAGWSDEDVEGFCYGNWRRVLEETLPKARTRPKEGTRDEGRGTREEEGTRTRAGG